MRILAISGSLRASSTNTLLVHYIARLAPPDVEIVFYEGLADLPHFTPDLDSDDAPVSVRSLRVLLQAVDGVLICTPEYAFGVPGTLKNALDWLVSSGDLWGKPVAAISSSSLASGGEKALASLLLTLTALGANVPEGGKLMLPMLKKKLDTNGDVVDPETIEALKAILDALVQAINALSM
jgi:NAD(P)H-dependent FMN reductase